MARKKRESFGVWYVVHHAVCVDRPDLRDDTYPVVRPGTRITNRGTHATLRSAVSYYDELIAGGFDFESEFVAAASVERHSADHCGIRSPDCVRRRVERTRDGEIKRVA